MDVGYAISSEEHRPLDLVRHARRAEECGFPFALISDHYHPWIDRQGQSPFVWAVIGGIAEATAGLRLGTGVTCPTIRMHPALVAQAAATAADMLPGRFFLGVGTGENLNEHILGDRWPSASERLEMLAEAVAVMRELWRGELTTFEGKHFRVEDARVYTLPDDPIEVVVAAAAPEAAELAARSGDGLVSTAPDPEVVQAYLGAGGEGPRFGQLTVCWAQTEEEARRTAYEWWPNAGLEGPLSQELPLPSHFEEAAAMVSEDDVARRVVCGPDPARHIEGIQELVDAGFDRVYVHQVGPDQDGFFDFYVREVLPETAEIEPRQGVAPGARA
ncbi:MAG TPA: TIGR03557 family F420-dependent LLM class oxidoreductase [Gaiellaceae bacterium]|nr:TIGR03557 family F420-dependent LLM class oxidoreductase [Gaiellaceae bacterium]